MFDKLVDLLVNFIEAFKFAIVIDAYQEGVVLRLGKYHRTITSENGVFKTGFHFLIPFYAEDTLVDSVVPGSLNLSSQSLMTKDGRDIVVAVILFAAIRDIKKAMLDVASVHTALTDAVYAVVGRMIQSSTWDEIVTPEFNDKVYAAARKNAWKYGIEITQLQFTDLVSADTQRYMIDHGAVTVQMR